MILYLEKTNSGKYQYKSTILFNLRSLIEILKDYHVTIVKRDNNKPYCQ